MGMQTDLSDVSSESFLILTVVLIAKSVRYLRSILLAILRHFPKFNPSVPDASLYDVVGSRLAGIVLLCDQLNLNRVNSCPNRSDSDSDCVVCLNRFGDGELVRKLACRHVFHKDCLDGWLGELNFSCPICRGKLVDDDSVDCTRRRVGKDLLTWFPIK